MSDFSQLLVVIEADPTLSKQQKAQIQEILANKEKRARLLSGTLGATIGVVVGKYTRLSTAAKVLLGVAGFGLGRLLYDVLSKHDRQFAPYNDQSKVYEMDHVRY